MARGANVAVPALTAQHRFPDPATDQTRALLKSVFGFDGFRPGQEEIVASVLAGRDVLAIMPTGGGKSLCYHPPPYAGCFLTLLNAPSRL